MTMTLSIAILAAVFAVSPESKSGAKSKKSDAVSKWIEHVDSGPADQRPPNWAHVKALMMRRPPAVGEDAPDFTLKTRGDDRSVTLSQFEGKKPVVLIFGSYT